MSGKIGYKKHKNPIKPPKKTIIETITLINTCWEFLIFEYILNFSKMLNGLKVKQYGIKKVRAKTMAAKKVFNGPILE